jgi:hypothetical protein
MHAQRWEEAMERIGLRNMNSTPLGGHNWVSLKLANFSNFLDSTGEWQQES